MCTHNRFPGTVGRIENRLGLTNQTMSDWEFGRTTHICVCSTLQKTCVRCRRQLEPSLLCFHSTSRRYTVHWVNRYIGYIYSREAVRQRGKSHMTVSVLAIAPASPSLKPSSKIAPPLKVINPELLTWSWINIAKFRGRTRRRSGIRYS